MNDWSQRLFLAGQRYLAPLAPLVEAADVGRRVRPRSRLLCAALAELAVVVHEAVGGRLSEVDQVGQAAALLSLLTKIDDQVIDHHSFHGGPNRDRDVVRTEVLAFLEPTWRSLVAATPANDEARCVLAAELGRRLIDLGQGTDGHHRQHLLDVIRRGWDIQADAVAVLAARPDAFPEHELDRVTAHISGLWLLMISLVGTVPAGARRMMTPAEQAAYVTWGRYIQRADALADLGKDAAEGLINTWPLSRVAQVHPETYHQAVATGDWDRLYRVVADIDADVDALVPPDVRRELTRDLLRLGAMDDLLAWIHRFLLSRYVVSPDSYRGGDDDPVGLAELQSLSGLAILSWMGEPDVMEEVA